MAESITITDNRTGESIEIPIEHGGVSSDGWRKLLPGIWFEDEAFTATAATRSAITDIDGDNGILRYRGYPIEQLAEQSTYLEVAYLLIFGELPTTAQLEQWTHDITYHTYIHENMRKRFLEGFHYDAHPMGMLVSSIAALSTFYDNAKNIDDPDIRYKQITRLIAKMPTLAAAAYRFSVGHALRLPRQQPELLGQLPVDDVEGRRAPLRGRPRRWPGRSTCCSSSTPTTSRTAAPPPCGSWARPTPTPTRPPPRPPPPSTAPATAAPTRPSSRCSTEIGSLDNVDAFVESVKQGEGKLQGFGHRVYKNYDPRAKIIKKAADDVFEVTGQNPLLDIALKLEEVALSDDYFISRKLYPNVDFYSGLIYQAMGFPTSMFTVLFAIPRTSGWLAHWVELLEQDQRIARPRQLYTGAGERDYVSIDKR